MNNRQRLADSILSWHGGGGSFMYQLGSHWYGDHNIGAEVILGAIGEIDELIFSPQRFFLDSKDVKELIVLKEKILREAKREKLV